MSSLSFQLHSLPTYASISTSRLQSLYSDVSRQKHSNPASYHAHVDWWRHTLEAFVSLGWQADIDPNGQKTQNQCNKLVLSLRRALVDKLRYGGVGKPLGLATTVSDLRNQNALINLQQFMSSSQSVYDTDWLPYRIASFVIGKPLWWALEHFDIVRSEDTYTETEMWKKMEGEYVMLSLVERAADALKELMKAGNLSLADSVFDVGTFRKKFGDRLLPHVILSELDTMVLLKYLERDRKVVLVDKDVIKFIRSPHEGEITLVDRGLLELKIAVEQLQAQVDNIEGKIHESSLKITNALRRGQKSVALSCLRSKKQLEELLSRRLGSLETLQSTMIRVETAAGDLEIVKLYESSTATLSAILSHPSLQKERVEETMEAMAAANAGAREIGEIIQIGGDIATADAGIDDTELEAELSRLIAEGEREKAGEREQDQMEVLRTAPSPPAGEEAVPTPLSIDLSAASPKPVPAT